MLKNLRGAKTKSIKVKSQNAMLNFKNVQNACKYLL